MNEQRRTQVTAAAVEQKTTVKETVRQLQDQFAQTGTLQGRDVNRILGNPTGGVEVTLRREYSTSTWKTL